MFTETETPSKMVGLDIPLNLERQTSFLEDDLALSSSTHESLSEKTITEAEDKSHEEEATQTSETSGSGPAVEDPPVIYVNEDAMDCAYDESSGSLSRQPELEEAPSPELFESDADDEAESVSITASFRSVLEEQARPSQPSPKKLSSAELIARADKFLLRRINKYLSGVPPPPNHTISQRDCDDFLVYLKQNRRYFWADPFQLDKNFAPAEPESSASLQESTEDKSEDTNTRTSNKAFHSTKAGLRNLSTAFDACEASSLKLDNNDSLAAESVFSDTTSSFSLSETLMNNASILSSFAPVKDPKISDVSNKETLPTIYTSVKVEEAVSLQWPDVYRHKCHEIYYNRNRAVEEFENLRMRLCDRYVGAETQSTCNVWFAKQMPGSARKRLLAKRNLGQSPGKRLSYLARRRRTFSSANLQGLVLPEKKQLLLNVRKGMPRKGKSPRGKSPRGKSPRGKTPRSSAKKRHLRKLLLEGPSPRKSKLETSKRALFQSPPADKPGPSRAIITMPVTNNNPQKIKRALFPTPKKNEASTGGQTLSLSFPESRKRKSEEELENSRQKFAKSLSFDCTRNLESSSSNGWSAVKHTSGNLPSKDGKGELSEMHRKKLLWAVAEALRTKGIGMGHPMFKQYATCLARTVRKFMPDLDNKNVPRKPGSTSDRMLKLAKRHVLLLVDAKTAH